MAWPRSRVETTFLAKPPAGFGQAYALDSDLSTTAHLPRSLPYHLLRACSVWMSRALLSSFLRLYLLCQRPSAQAITEQPDLCQCHFSRLGSCPPSIYDVSMSCDHSLFLSTISCLIHADWPYCYKSVSNYYPDVVRLSAAVLVMPFERQRLLHSLTITGTIRPEHVELLPCNDAPGLGEARSKWRPRQQLCAATMPFCWWEVSFTSGGLFMHCERSHEAPVQADSACCEVMRPETE